MMEAAHSHAQGPLREIPYTGPICQVCKYPAPDTRKRITLGKLGMWLWGKPSAPLCLVCWQFLTNITQIKDIAIDELHRRGIYAGVPKGAISQSEPLDKTVFHQRSG